MGEGLQILMRGAAHLCVHRPRRGGDHTTLARKGPAHGEIVAGGIGEYSMRKFMGAISPKRAIG